MESYTAADILRIADEQDVRFIRLQFTDLFGTIKNVEIPRSQLSKALDNKMMFDGSSIEGFVRIEESDMYLYPDLSTWLIMPWSFEDGRVARLICDVYKPDGSPFEGDPRHILRKVLDEAKALGFTQMFVGPEPEFFLFKKNAQGEPTLDLNDKGGYFDLAPVDLGENCRRDIVLTLEEMGFEIEASHHETAPGQHEIDFKYSDAISAADHIQTFKLIVKSVARKHHLHATFMPKPLYGIAGSGMHCHISLFQGEVNSFEDAYDDFGLSTTAYQFMAGILHHARSIAAITNPTVNSYKRLVPGHEAPVYVAWSAQNRSPMIRIPSSRGTSTRIEVRNPDPAANPYLAFAVLLQAGLEGIKKEYKAPPSTDRNIYNMNEAERLQAGIMSLPNNLSEALTYLKADSLICSALGEHALSNFLEAKQIEWDMYRLQVHQWERDQYMSFY